MGSSSARFPSGSAPRPAVAASSTAVAAVGVAAFLGNNLAPAIDALAWLRDVSPFHYYSGGQPLRNGFQFADAAILAAASVVLVILGGPVLDRRDIAV